MQNPPATFFKSGGAGVRSSFRRCSGGAELHATLNNLSTPKFKELLAGAGGAGSRQATGGEQAEGTLPLLLCFMLLVCRSWHCVLTWRAGAAVRGRVSCII